MVTATPKFACAACGFVVLESAYGGYEICPICGWEDDCVQLGNPCSGGGANSESLVDAQAAVLERLPLSVQDHRGFVRLAAWRPLSEVEIARYAAEHPGERWGSGSIIDPNEVYW